MKWVYQISFYNIQIKYNRCTLSACRRQSILRIFPFWSGFESTHIAGFFPVIDNTKSSRHSWAMSFRNFPKSLDAHFCFTSGFSAYKKQVRWHINQRIHDLKNDISFLRVKNNNYSWYLKIKKAIQISRYIACAMKRGWHGILFARYEMHGVVNNLARM